ncbi:MAG: hypothetical protein ACYC5N_09550, partial [Endomicrobiales bacterium]
GLVLTETLFAFFLSLSALLFIRACRAGSARRFLWAGVVLGLTCLVRPDPILIPLFIAAILFLTSAEKLRAGALFALFLAGLAVPFVPWSAYNYSRFHCVFPVHSGGLGPLVRGSAEYALQGTTENDVESWKKLDTYYERLGVYKAPEKLEQQLLREGMDIIVRHPFKFAALLAHRLPQFWLTSHSAVFGIQRSNSEYLRKKNYFVLGTKSLLYGLQTAILLLGIAGFFLVNGRSGPHLFLSVLFLYPSLYVFVDIANRHHIPFMPYFFMFGAAAAMKMLCKGTKAVDPT